MTKSPRKEVLSRERLYDLVWSEPATKLSKRLGSSELNRPGFAGDSSPWEHGVMNQTRRDSAEVQERAVRMARELERNGLVNRESRLDREEALELHSPRS